MGKRQRKGRRRLVGGCRHYFFYFLQSYRPCSSRPWGSPPPFVISLLVALEHLVVVRAHILQRLGYGAYWWSSFTRCPASPAKLVAAPCFSQQIAQSVALTHITYWSHSTKWPCGPEFQCTGPFAASMLQPLGADAFAFVCSGCQHSRHTWAFST